MIIVLPVEMTFIHYLIVYRNYDLNLLRVATYFPVINYNLGNKVPQKI